MFCTIWLLRFRFVNKVFRSQYSASSKEPACQYRDIRDRVRFLGQEDLLEEGMATHSSILAWRIPWTEEPGRLLFIELQRIGHN